ncbi:MAG TPA: hypothetical protein VFU22_07845 [Roseiflexaceae bacterium]|nr:hypothetical protein [Roseiflexaceae bacterium]
MWNNLEMQAEYIRELRRDQLAAAARERQIHACGRPLALSRLAARPLGRALFSLGAWLLRYGKDERATAVGAYRVSARSVELN